MSNFQVTILPAQPSGRGLVDESERFAVRQHSGAAEKIIQKIDDLEGVWDQVIDKLTEIAAKSEVAAEASNYELSTIEFNIGIEAGLSVGLVTKGDASVSVIFSRKSTSDHKDAKA